MKNISVLLFSVVVMCANVHAAQRDTDLKEDLSIHHLSEIAQVRRDESKKLYNDNDEFRESLKTFIARNQEDSQFATLHETQKKSRGLDILALHALGEYAEQDEKAPACVPMYYYDQAVIVSVLLAKKALYARQELTERVELAALEIREGICHHELALLDELRDQSPSDDATHASSSSSSAMGSSGAASSSK